MRVDPLKLMDGIVVQSGAVFKNAGNGSVDVGQ